MAGTSPDLIVRVAANISALQTDMAAASKSVEATTASWHEFTTGFDIESAIHHPLETAKEALAAFAGEMGPLAVGALATAGAIAAVGTAVFELAAKAAETGEQLVDMSLKTGIEVGALSLLKSAVEVTGGSVDTVTNAIFMFQKRLGEDTPAFEKGLARIGLSLRDIRDLKPDEQFLLIGSALRDMADPVERNAAGAELFGKQFRELVPTIMKDLPGMIEQFQALGSAWSEEDAKAAEDFEIATRKLKMEVDLLFQKIGKDLIPLIQLPLDLAVGTVGAFLKTGPTADALKGWQELHLIWTVLFGEDLPKLPPIAGEAKTGIDALHLSTKQYTTVIDEQAKALSAEIIQGELFRGHLDHLREAVVPLTAQQTLWADEMLRGGDSAKEVAKWLGVAEIAVKNHEAAVKQSAATQKALLAEIAKLEGEHVTLHAKGLLDMDAAEEKATQHQFEEASKAYTQIEKAQAALHDAEMKGSLDSNTYKIMKIWEEVDQKEKAFAKLGVDTSAYNLAVESLASEEANAITDIMSAAVDTMYGKAVFAIDQTAAKVTASVQATVSSIFSLGGSGGDMAAAAAARGGSVAHDSYGNPYIYIPGVNQPGARAGGGPVTAGSPYMVGERGPELFVPQASGSIVPNGAGGAPTVNIYVTQPLGTPDAISRVVLQALQAAARNQGIRL